jgi:putative ABC transport system ATP-binding protein
MSLKKNPPLIELRNISKSYNLNKDNEFKALKSIDLEINKGDFVAIMGPSGSGKSTLMNILGALDTPTHGSYIINGEDISKFSNNQLADFRNRDVGFVFQQFNLLPRINVRNNVLLPTLYGSIENREERLKEVLEKVGLLDKAKNKSNQLSGGQIQRVAIARALIMKPSIIMADEPTGNLDTKTSMEIMKIFKEINEEGNTIILITHEDDIAAYAKRIIKLKDGEIVN